MAEIPISITFTPAPGSITDIQAQVQKSFTSSPVRVAFKADGIDSLRAQVEKSLKDIKVSVNVTGNSSNNGGGIGVGNADLSKYQQIRDILREINADRIKLQNSALTKSSGELQVYTNNISKLSSKMADLLGITSQLERNNLENALRTGNISEFVNQLNKAGMSVQQLTNLTNMQEVAQRKVDVAVAQSAANLTEQTARAINDETRKQAAIDKTTQAYVAQAQKSYTKYSTSDLMGTQEAVINRVSNGDNGVYTSLKQNLLAVKSAIDEVNATGLNDTTTQQWVKLNNAVQTYEQSLNDVAKSQELVNAFTQKQINFGNLSNQANGYFSKFKDNITRNINLSAKWSDLLSKIGNSNAWKTDKEARDYLVNLEVESKAAGVEVETLSQKMSNLFNQHFSTAVAMLGVNALRQGVLAVYQNVVELDKQVVNLQIASGQSRSSIQNLVSQYSALGKEIGATTIEVAQASDTFLRQGKTMEETTTLVKNATMLSKLGEIDSTEAAKDLTSAMKGYNVSVADSINIIDKFVKVDMNAAVSAGDIATAMAECAVSADVAGISMDKLVGYIARVSEVTQDGAESVGKICA